MDNESYLEIVGMLNAFPMGNSNPDAMMGSYELALQGLCPTAVIEAARRFTLGDVQGQSKTFAPSIAEFVQEARQRQEYIDIKALPKLPPPVYRHHTGTPFYIRQEKTRTRYKDCAILAENVGIDEYRRRVREFPEGHAWIAAVATVYGPPAMEIAVRA